MRKTGVPLESHKLWPELVRLETEERNKVLQQIVDKKFTIGDAIQVTNLTIYTLFKYYINTRHLIKNISGLMPNVSILGCRKQTTACKVAKNHGTTVRHDVGEYIK